MQRVIREGMENLFISLAEKLIDILKPEVFWDAMSDCFGSKSVVVKESALVLLHATLEKDGN